MQLRTIAQIIGLIVALQMGASCTAIKPSQMDSNISIVTDQFRMLSDADTRHYVLTEEDKPFDEYVKEGVLAHVPKPPSGAGSEYHNPWKSAPMGTNNHMDVEYMELTEVPDEFCKEWNNAKHSELGRIIMPSCQEAVAPYSCAVKKLGKNMRNFSPPDQCGQTCCIAGNSVGNLILFKNGYVNKKDKE